MLKKSTGWFDYQNRGQVIQNTLVIPKGRGTSLLAHSEIRPVFSV